MLTGTPSFLDLFEKEVILQIMVPNPLSLEKSFNDSVFVHPFSQCPVLIFTTGLEILFQPLPQKG